MSHGIPYYRSITVQLETLCMLDGKLERPLDASRWFVPPYFEIVGDRLRWERRSYSYPEYPDRGPILKTAGPAAGMLEAFVGLETAPPNKILTFARKHGFLGVRKREEWDEGVSGSYPTGSAFGFCFITGTEDLHDGWEPLEHWRFWAGKFRCALTVAVDLRKGREQPALLRELFGPDENSPGPDENIPPPEEVKQLAGEELVEVRAIFYDVLESWMRLGRVSLTLNGYQDRLQLSTEVLFSGLVLQLISIACSSSGVAICTGCGLPYAPSRSPPKGRRNYCRACGRTAAVRDAVRAFRSRRR